MSDDLCSGCSFYRDESEMAEVDGKSFCAKCLAAQLRVAKAPGAASLNTPEPAPVKTEGVAVWDLVLDDMRERDATGRAKYGTPLQVHNGRRPLVDLYQELLDATVYTRQKIEQDRQRKARVIAFIKTRAAGFREEAQREDLAQRHALAELALHRATALEDLARLFENGACDALE